MAREGLVNHYIGVRLRVTGSGNLRGQLQSMDETKVTSFAPTLLQATNSGEPMILANFTNQRASLYIYTSGIDETFQISRISVYLKPVATAFPQ